MTATVNPPKLPLREMFRLGLFQLGLGIMNLLTLGLLNRVMINELAIPPAIAAGLSAIPLFMSPARVWFGQLSDSKPLWGYHRSSYVWLGSALFSFSVWLALQSLWQLGESLYTQDWSALTITWLIVLALLFAVFGLTLSMSSTPFAALLVDITDEEERSRLVGVVWSLLMVGIVIGAITVARLLGTPAAEVNPKEAISVFSDPIRATALRGAIDRVFIIVPSVVVALSFLATWGIEKRYSRFGERIVDREDQIGLRQALKILTTSRQTTKFFVFLIFMTLGIFMQDAVLEPYGATVFGMSIGETTKLNAPFGIGTLLGISLSGFLIAPSIGKQNTARLGCTSTIGTLILLILVGETVDKNLLRLVVLFFGFASGITTTGAISLMLDLTAVATAGTFIGAWGLAQAIARGSATFLGGLTLEIGKQIFPTHLFPTPLLAYSFVFSLQIVMMALAILLLNQVNVKEFQETTKKAILEVIASDVE
ncbi:MAG: BCD family MFS transporter [Pseudanabaenaceae cyanobacterium SKYGB_i_bin29]|nr:BCD family MFS transporter [Pseudanabaenaceae cyanobacterium SKYG29]MDW8422312.1 BCD family MFS transporter [Pseudanabaenaceae cyanobacterium SKYGB_i_bin29]